MTTVIDNIIIFFLILVRIKKAIIYLYSNIRVHDAFTDLRSYTIRILGLNIDFNIG